MVHLLATGEAVEITKLILHFLGILVIVVLVICILGWFTS
jgi:hypothetical protein